MQNTPCWGLSPIVSPFWPITGFRKYTYSLSNFTINYFPSSFSPSHYFSKLLTTWKGKDKWHIVINLFIFHLTFDNCNKSWNQFAESNISQKVLQFWVAIYWQWPVLFNLHLLCFIWALNTETLYSHCNKLNLAIATHSIYATAKTLYSHWNSLLIVCLAPQLVNKNMM